MTAFIMGVDAITNFQESWLSSFHYENFVSKNNLVLSNSHTTPQVPLMATLLEKLAIYERI
jgi:hypothetical protein